MIILASQSPRRIQLMQEAGFDFTSIPANTEETYPLELPPAKVAEYLAHQKAAHVFQSNQDKIIIGADTIVVYNNQILGKPKDSDDAFHMLSLLSGKTHSVFTGVCMLSKDKKIIFTEETKVSFFPLTDKEIYHYIDSGEPFDKAGAYAIQGNAKYFVKEIHGDFYNVVGLPIARLKRELTNI